MGGAESRPPVPASRTGVQVVVTAGRNFTPQSGRVFTVYEIRLKFLGFEWTIGRRFSEVCDLHAKLRKRVPGFAVKRPPKTFRRDATPQFVAARLEAVQWYLSSILADPAVWNQPATREFLELSYHSFDGRLGRKGPEGWMWKRSGGRSNKSKMFNIWRKRWFVVKDNYIAYFKSPTSEHPQDVLMLDKAFTYHGVGRHMILFETPFRKLLVRTASFRDTCQWLDALKQFLFYTPRLAAGVRYDSFAPVRNPVDATWFVGGAATFAAVATELDQAVSQIFISGWWLVPQVQLVRRRHWEVEQGNQPAGVDVRVTLADILKRKADLGVQVYVLLYKEIGMGVMRNRSAQAKADLCALSPNIHVIRHPDHYSLSGTVFWTHHDKIVCIDQRVAFVGGIDLCYGRYDSPKHPLGDQEADTQALWPGEDFYNPCAEEAVQARKAVYANLQYRPAFSAIDTAATAAIAQTKDMLDAARRNALAASTAGREAVDAAHRVAAQAGVPMPAGLAPTPPPRRSQPQQQHQQQVLVSIAQPSQAPAPPPRRRSSITGRMGITTDMEEPVSDADSVRSGEVRNNEAAVAAMVDAAPQTLSATATEEEIKAAEADVQAAEKEYNVTAAVLNRIPCPTVHPRLPWHDIHVRLSGAAAADVAFHFIQRWNHHRVVKNEIPLPPLMPRSDTTLWWTIPEAQLQQAAATCRAQEPSAEPTSLLDRPIHEIHATLFQNGDDLLETKDAVPDASTPLTPAVREAVHRSLHQHSLSIPGCTAQIVRSASMWSAGVTTETSVAAAYCHIIESSQHLLYMENQYFISSTAGSGVANQVSTALLNRLRVAIHRRQAYRCIIVLPAHPEGDHHTNRSVQAVLHYQYYTLCRGPDSILCKLKREFPECDPWQYLSVYSLRQEGLLTSGARVTEQVYVHSKLIIADDRTVAIGSANINDRSLMGDRDSEIVAIIEGGGAMRSRLAGNNWDAGAFACTLRRTLFMIHLGYDLAHAPSPPPEVIDPVPAASFVTAWLTRAIRNTLYFESRYPHVASLTGLTISRGALPPHHFLPPCYEQELDATAPQWVLQEPQGHLVLFSLRFKEMQELKPSAGSAEGWVAEKVFQ